MDFSRDTTTVPTCALTNVHFYGERRMTFYARSFNWIKALLAGMHGKAALCNQRALSIVAPKYDARTRRAEGLAFCWMCLCHRVPSHPSPGSCLQLKSLQFNSACHWSLIFTTPQRPGDGSRLPRWHLEWKIEWRLRINIDRDPQECLVYLGVLRRWSISNREGVGLTPIEWAFAR